MVTLDKKEALEEVKTRPNLTALTSLRFVAAFLVVCTHTSLLASLPQEIQPFLTFPLGTDGTGVCFFFVLSGFILTFSYLEKFKSGQEKIWSFYRARFARIAPMHVTALLLISFILVVSWNTGICNNVALCRSPETSTPLNMVASWFLSLILLVEIVPIWLFGHSWNPPAWSLGVELVFYAGFPFLCRFFLSKLKRSISIFQCLVVVLLLQVIFWFSGIILVAAFSDGEQQYWLLAWGIQKFPIFRIWEFIAGCLIGMLFLNWSRKESSNKNQLSPRFTKGLTILLLVVIIGVLYIPGGNGLTLTSILLTNSKVYILYTPLFAALIFLVATKRTFLNKFLERKRFVLLGEASYSLYLIHWPLLILAQFAINFFGTPFTILIDLIMVLSSVMLSIFLYKTVELPWRRKLRGY